MHQVHYGLLDLAVSRNLAQARRAQTYSPKLRILRTVKL